MMRVGVLGAGGHSSVMHGPALAACAKRQPGRVELAAVCDLQVDRARTYAERFGFERIYTDLEQMLDDEHLDGPVAITPVPLTEELAGLVLRRGIPVVIEKPPCPDSQAAQRLLAIADETGTPHMVSLNRRFSPAMARARMWMAEATSERPPQVVLARVVRHARSEVDFITSTGIHLIDAVISLLGRPVEVCSEHLSTGQPLASFAQARIGFEGGARGPA